MSAHQRTSSRLPNRREFVEAAASLLAVPTIISASALGEDRPAPSDRINVAIIGLGSRGFNLIHYMLNEPDAQIVAVCDVHKLHYRDLPWGKGQAFGREPAREKIEAHYADQSGSGSSRGLGVYADYREMYAREDFDAVVVCTPDHWHAITTLEALQAGKDVYCEKPVTHLFREGQLVYQEVARQGAVFQAGSQQRSDRLFRHAVELVRNGVIGAVKHVEVGLPPGYSEPMGDPTVTSPPEHLDYELWCGPSPALPYMRARHHRWWRGHCAYGGGVLMDWIGHHNDIAHWALDVDASGPVRVEAVDWTWPETDVYNTPHHYEIRCEYAGGVTSSISTRNKSGTKWIGEDGWIHVDRGRLSASDERWKSRDFDPGPFRVYESPGHVRNFLDCMKSREPCAAPAEIAHRSITPGYLGYVSNELGRPLQWDAKGEEVPGDDEANQLLRQLNYREPWTLEA